jgi:hypothetical protein
MRVVTFASGSTGHGDHRGRCCGLGTRSRSRVWRSRPSLSASRSLVYSTRSPGASGSVGVERVVEHDRAVIGPGVDGDVRLGPIGLLWLRLPTMDLTCRSSVAVRWCDDRRDSPRRTTFTCPTTRPTHPTVDPSTGSAEDAVSARKEPRWVAV